MSVGVESVLPVVCYVGVVLYGGVLSVSGRSRYGASWQLLLLYVGFFPLPAGSLGQLVQTGVLAFAVASLGPDVLCRNLATSAWGDVLSFAPVPEYVTPANVASIVREDDVVFLTVDNHATRRLVDL